MGKALFWHRRDLRIEDNAGLYHALKNNAEVFPIFIFDTTILNKLRKKDQRLIFIHREISRLKKEYQELNSDLLVFYGDPIEIIPLICSEYGIAHVYANRDYEPYAQERDLLVYKRLLSENISFQGKKDHVIFEKNEILKADNSPYTIFTPYKNKCLEKLNDFYLKSYPVEKYIDNLAEFKSNSPLITLEEMDFSSKQDVEFPGSEINIQTITNYAENRDFPGKNGTSKLSIHLRFGTISIRKLAQKAIVHNQSYLNELIWRDFYQMILYHFPYSAQDSFKKKYDQILWENNENYFKAWCDGKTGYPIVDAGMRELNETGFMHNRVRMIVASFLTKHLLIDWRWGETYFAEKLLDYELASNVGGWQWAASSGCDAAPYFRVFNPSIQEQKFDKDLIYIKKWLPEFGTNIYPKPIVEHKQAREKAINLYKKHLSE